MKKKIMYLLDYPIDLVGGAQISTKTLCDGLVENLYKIVVICPELINTKSKDYKFKVIAYKQIQNFNVINLFKLIKILYKFINEETPDIIHAQMPFSAMAVGIIKKICKKLKFEYIFTDRGLYSGYSKHSLFFLKNVLTNAKFLICTTYYNKNLWLKKIRTPVLVIPNSISMEFENALDKIQDLNKKTHPVLTIGFAGRIASEKNWPLSIGICKLLKQRSVEFEVYFAFGIYNKNDKQQVQIYISELKKYINEENIKIFFNISQDKMPLFYKELDIFILTSSFESFGKTAIEAMACDCAVLGTDVGGIPEIIQKSSNIYTIFDLEKCIKYIIQLQNNSILLENDKRYFKKRYLSNFSVKCNIEKHKEIYEI